MGLISVILDLLIFVFEVIIPLFTLIVYGGIFYVFYVVCYWIYSFLTKNDSA